MLKPGDQNCAELSWLVVIYIVHTTHSTDIYNHAVILQIYELTKGDGLC